MEANEEEYIINSHPIKEELVAFRHQFESSQARLSFVGSSHPVKDIFSAEFASDLVLDLIGALETLSAARVLRSQIHRKTHLRADLFGLGSKAGSNDFKIKSTIPLVELVINNAPDVEIWRAVFDLISLSSPKQLTPPTAFEKAVFDTPLRSSSASQRGIEQTHSEVDHSSKILTIYFLRLSWLSFAAATINSLSASFFFCASSSFFFSCAAWRLSWLSLPALMIMSSLASSFPREFAEARESDMIDMFLEKASISFSFM